MDDKYTLAGCVGHFVLFIGVLVLGSIASGWALKLLWGWFVVPVFGLPTLTIAQALGIGTLVSFLTRDYSTKSEKDKKDWTQMWVKAYTVAVFAPLFSVGFGWVIHLFTV